MAKFFQKLLSNFAYLIGIAVAFVIMFPLALLVVVVNFLSPLRLLALRDKMPTKFKRTRTFGFFSNWRLTQISERVGSDVRGDVLDFGCGDGRVLKHLSRQPNFKSGIGIDQNIVPKKEGNTAFRNFEFSNKLPFRSAAFDTVLSLAVIEHMTYQEEAVREMYRVLRPNGTLILTTPAPYADALLRVFEFLGMLPDIAEHKRYFSIFGITDLLESAGFRVEKTKKFQVGLNQLVVARKSKEK